MKTSIEYNGVTINFTFNTGIFNILADEFGHDFDFEKIEEYLASMKGRHILNFYAQILYSGAKWAMRKESNFPYDVADAHEWIEPFGGIEKIVEAFAKSINPNVDVTQIKAEKDPK